ncbi:unnamed protein product [Leptidea sinapis]|uniref:Uncharacterized protein n=1 Tax=Leptidea sinapis TaxID=189913 RepID=A0A5E4PWK1_9NEOP|nr:unnamed protein product [Leptidea sinapis]
MDHIILKINVNTSSLTSQAIQDVFNLIRKNILNESSEDMDPAMELLWKHINTLLPHYNDQLLCSICFYTLMTDKNEEAYLLKILEILNKMMLLEKSNKEDVHQTSVGVSLMYGLLQSSYLNRTPSHQMLVQNCIDLTFKLLTLLAYKYTQFTFLVFKILSTFKKLKNTVLHKHIFTQDNQVTLLNLVNHNWENPITGVRLMNKGVFQLLISVIHEDIYVLMLKEINKFYWNKAKYLMLSEIIEQRQDYLQTFLKENNINEGLIHSLFKPGLVSAGSDMYYAVLRKIKSAEEWATIFLEDVMKIFVGPKQKAIENFCNYWLLHTLKIFPSVMDIILDELKSKNYCESKLLSCLCVMKQVCKEGLLKIKLQDYEDNILVNYILTGLKHNNAYIRMLAFEILCVSNSKPLPRSEAYKLVLEFIHFNINSDCTVLRTSMINCIANFLNHLNNTYVTNTKINVNDYKNLQDFCIELQQLIKSSLNVNGNYQRKITTVTIINVLNKNLMNNVRTIKERKLSLGEKLKSEMAWMLSDKDVILMLISLLKDPAEDIRKTAVNVLLTYNVREIIEMDMINILLNDAVKCLRSKFFYEIDCGRCIFNLIINIMLTNDLAVSFDGLESPFQGIQDVFKFWYNELTSEFQMKRNIVDSVENGKQLHSILSVIYVIFDSCSTSKHKLEIPEHTMMSLLTILDDVSNQFQWKEEANVSSDFSEMSDMVQSLIQASSVYSNVADETHTSGLHQAVSCELLSLILIQNLDDVQICEKCLNTISRVLETCRHKGAIEAAGTELGLCIRNLTMFPNEATSHLPSVFLERKLNELICESNRMASVTRRGAGLSILVHKIVSQDNRKGKANEKDLPKAIYIHFLAKIVIDSSLSTEVMYYSAKLAELAFGNLTSPHWQISIATVACDEFRTHLPSLWKMILIKLKNTDFIDMIQGHSNLVPILNIIANMARRYNFEYDLKEQTACDKELFTVFIRLLDSPIYTVRRLVARCILNIYSDDIIHHFLLHHEITSENLLHGVLLLMSNYFNQNKSSNLFDKINLREKFASIISIRKHSYICKGLIEDVFGHDDDEKNMLADTFKTIQMYTNAPGIYLWSNRRVKVYIENATWLEVLDNIVILSAFNEFEQHIYLLCKKMEDCVIPEHILQKIVQNLIDDFSDVKDNSNFWKFLYQASKQVDLSFLLQTPLFRSLADCNEFTYKRRYCLPLVTRLQSRSLNDKISQKNISFMIQRLSDPSYDTAIRHKAAVANNELAPVLQNLQEDVKINAIISAIILLSDEDEDIRNVATEFCKLILHQTENIHPFICLNLILSKSFIETVLNNPSKSVKIIAQDITDFMESLSSPKKDEYNPFANDSKNIYFEVNLVSQLLDSLMKYFT